MSKDADRLAEGKEDFERHVDAEGENRKAALEDLRFARLGEQWPREIQEQRKREMRPCLTINRMPAFIRQVVNDARQNKPQIKVKPVDSQADPDTAKIIDGLIRNIEYASNADIAYDTAGEFAITMGFGYIRVAIEYSHDDSFDKELRIQRVSNPFSVYGDPHSTAADSSDWNSAFITDLMSKDAFEEKYKGAEAVNWGDYEKLSSTPWMDGESVVVAEWWKREEVQDELVQMMLADGSVVGLRASRLKESAELFAGAREVMRRPVKSYKITQRIMTGAEVLEEHEWAGQYIPVIPVYGEEVNIEGKRWFRSLIRDAKDAQSMFNFWRTATTELVALAPKAPFIGPEGFADGDPRWDTANTASHPYLEYKPVANQPPPQRQPFSGVPAGALQEALNASDDMKSIMGLYDASLGARSNETSGKAILVRQREGDVSTFHFIDNLSRAIRHTGRVLLDLIPLVYTKERMIRVLGQQGETQPVPLGQPVVMDPQTKAYRPPNPEEAAMARVFDLALGKYDLAVESGPSFTTRREEAVMAMTEIMRAYPPAAPVIADLLAKNMDWPGADEMAERFKQLREAQMGGGQQGVDPAQMQKAVEQNQQLQAEVQQLQMQLIALRGDQTTKQDANRIKAFEADTERAKVTHEITKPPEPPAMTRQ